MTVTLPPSESAEITSELDLLQSDLLGLADERQSEQVEEGVEQEAPLRAGRIALAAALSTLSSAWMTAHLFHGVFTAVLVSIIGVACGVLPLLLASRRAKPGLLAYAPLPLALVVATIAAAASGDGANLPSLLKDTLRGGGLQNPPIPFDGGWRAIVVILFAFVAAAGMTLATSLRKPKLAVGIPAIVTLAATLLQPKGGQLSATLGAVVLIAAGMALAYGADLADKVDAGAGFETRRLVRGVVLLSACIGILALVAQSDVLFPATEKDTVIPPRKPPAATPLPPDLLLFSVTSPAVGPWRLGVLDSYGDDAFLLPSIDTRRNKDAGSEFQLGRDARTSISQQLEAKDQYTATFTLKGIKGQTLPAPGGLTKLSGLPPKAAYDPDTGLVALKDDNVSDGITYTATAIKPPSGKQLQSAKNPPADVLARYTQLPPPGPGAKALIDKAPAKAFDRLQYLRLTLLSKVVAAGSGGAKDITPADVDAMLKGGNGSPYQIVAAQVMLARWAGIPARIGFGFYGGSTDPATAKAKVPTVDFHPVDGSAWLEAYFEGYDWVPIVGTPQKAQPSISKDQKKQSQARQTAQLALSIYIPVKQLTVQFIYEVVRYYVVRVVAIGAPIVLLIVGYPWLLKLARRRRRKRWAERFGPSGRVMVAYAEFRDACYDLNIGAARDTPLEFLTAIEQDDEHDELAWATTRIIWGDLSRDLREEDILDVEALSRSVIRRVRSEQPFSNRFVAAVTRTSLRDPWTTELPNLWWPGRIGKAPRRRKAARRGVPVLATGGAA